MSLESGSKVPISPISEILYPTPQSNLVLECRGVREFPLSRDPQFAQYTGWSSIITRYIPGRNYSGPQLPVGTNEVLHIILLHSGSEPVNVGEPTGHMVSYVDLAYATPNGVWDRFLRNYQDGYHAVFQTEGNVGRLIFQGGFAITYHYRDRYPGLQLGTDSAPIKHVYSGWDGKRTMREIVGRKRAMVVGPIFMPIHTELLPVLEEAYEAKKAELLEQFKSYT